MCFQWYSNGFPVVFQCVPIMQINTGSPLGYHWMLASSSVVPVASQCTYGSSGLPVCSNYANYHWKYRRWVLASAVSVASQCTCGSRGLPVWSVQWYPSVLTEPGLDVIRSSHFPACDPLCIQLVWWELFDLNWFHVTCNPKYTKTVMMLTSKTCAEWCWSTHMC